MTHQKSELYFLFILLFGMFVLTFFIFKPFLYALILAIVFATVFSKVHKRFLVITRESKGLSAFLSTVTVLIIVVVPLSFLSVKIFQETTQLYSSVIDNGGAITISRNLNETIQSFTKYYSVPMDFTVDINQYLGQGLNWLIQNFAGLFKNVAKAMMGIFIFLIALFYLFKDGHKLKNSIVVASPLQDIYDELIFKKLALAINSVIKGSLAVAIVQGLLTAIGFYLFGVPNPVLWGSVAVVAALVPNIGTALVVIPAILYLYFTGETISAIGLMLWGLTAVGLIDNFLGPKLAERGMMVHPFLILLSILGGISFFGPLGFLLGPITLSMLFVLLEIYPAISKKNEC